MSRKLIADRAMTAAERQARYRAARKADVPIVRPRRLVDQRARAKRWVEAVAELTALQGQYQDWLETLPENLKSSATADALSAICAIDLAELQDTAPPRGFGRD